MRGGGGINLPCFVLREAKQACLVEGGGITMRMALQGTRKGKVSVTHQGHAK